MALIELTINREKTRFDVDPDMPLLWAIRDFAGLTGTKFGCGIGLCGSCTVLMNGNPIRSCTVPVSSAKETSITTIEGLSQETTHPVQEAWISEQVPQCGYCQSGQILAAVALLERDSNPSDEEIEAAMSRILCRCGTYPRIRKAIKKAANS